MSIDFWKHHAVSPLTPRHLHHPCLFAPRQLTPNPHPSILSPTHPPTHRSQDVRYQAHRPIKAGEQIFSYYGDDWFQYRPFDEISPATVGKAYVKLSDPLGGATRVPGCPTTTLGVSGGRVVARKGFKKGKG